MATVKRAQDNSEINNLIFGVAIKKTKPNQRHVGLFYKTQTNDFKLLHLAWHHKLLNEPLDKSYFIAESALDNINKIAMSAFVQAFPNIYKSVPYAIAYSNKPYFDKQGKFIPQPLGVGLTCSTFVLAIHQNFGITLADINSWEKRPDDSAWQKKIIKDLEPYASIEHINAIKNDIGTVRVRPEEAASCVISKNIPMEFNSATALAKQILLDMSK